MAYRMVQKDIRRNEAYMKEELGAGSSYDVDYREVIVLHRRVQLYYINGLVDDMTVVQLLKKVIEINDDEVEEDKLASILRNRLVNLQVDIHTSMETLSDELLNGLIVVFVDGEREAFVVDVRHYPGREPQEPDTERVIRGSRDGFTENIINNTALIRRRVKDKGLRNEIVQIGTRSKSDVCISYINSLANDELVSIIKEKLKKLEIDQIVMADKALIELFFNKKWSPFPIVRFTERPDVAAHHILSGYIILIVDTSPNVIIIPTTYFDHLEHAEEFRQTPSVGTFIRWIRITAVLASIFLLPIWYLFIKEPQLLPESLSFIGPKEKGNVPISIQIILADIGVEFLRMAAVHTPTPLATALGLIAAVLIGDIAINVGLFSPEVILYVAISTVGFYVTPSYEMSVANKIMKVFILIASIFFGVYGFLLSSTISLIYLVQLNALQIPYMWPLIPFNLPAFFRFVIRLPISIDKKRPRIVRPKQLYRQSL
mgnify:FL=1